MAKSKSVCYVVWSGHDQGVFSSWSQTKKLIDGYKGAKYKGFKTESEAKNAFFIGYDEWKKQNDKIVDKNNEPPADYANKLTHYLTVDAAFNGKVSEWRGVMMPGNIEVFRSPVYTGGSNNIGEFLALVQGVSYLMRLNDTSTPIFSDSVTALAWYRDNNCKTTVLEKGSHDQEMLDKIDKSIVFLKKHKKKFTNDIHKWHTGIWGEIPADFGRK
jgi:ribonuclease HI